MVFRQDPPLPSLRSRPVRAIALALLVCLLGLASVGFASDGDQPVATTITSFGVPAPAVGDKGFYSRLLDHETGTTARLDQGDPYTFTFAWEEDGAMFDSQGRHHWTNDLRTERTWWDGHWRNESHLSYYDQVDHALVAQTWIGNDEAEADSDILGERVHGWFGNDTYFAPGAHDEWGTGAPCGLFTPLQGADLNVTTAWRLEHACTQVGLHPWIAPAEYTFVGAAEQDGHVFADYAASSLRSVVIDGTTHSFDERSHHLANLRFRDDVPYPVRVTYAERNGAGWENVTVVLKAFERGDGPALGQAASTEAPLPAVEFVPTPTWGFDDTGFDHPYPLSQAWADARDHPTDPTLRDFLDAHPDAYVVDVWFWEVERDAEMYRQWMIEVTDGVDQVTVCPYQKHAHTGATGGPPSEVPVHIPFDTLDFFFDCNDDDRQDNPDAYQPGLRPSVTSMAAVWAEVAPLFGSERAPNEYSLWIWSDHEGAAREVISIGIDWIPQSDVGALTSRVQETERTRITWSLDFGPDGSLQGFRTGGYLERRGNGSLLPGDSGGDPSLSPSSVTVGPPIRGWEWPSPQEVGLVGAVAASLALLYMLWPWLKALLLPLFSRIDLPRALAHPKRAEIVAAVEAEPGIHFEELRRRTGLATGALQHHLGKLTDTGLLRQRKAFGYTGFYPKGDASTAPVDGAASVRSETAQLILEAWQADPAMSVSELAGRLGLSRQAVHYHVKRLRAAGLAP